MWASGKLWALRICRIWRKSTVTMQYARVCDAQVLRLLYLYWTAIVNPVSSSASRIHIWCRIGCEHCITASVRASHRADKTRIQCSFQQVHTTHTYRIVMVNRWQTAHKTQHKRLKHCTSGGQGIPHTIDLEPAPKWDYLSNRAPVTHKHITHSHGLFR